MFNFFFGTKAAENQPVEPITKAETEELAKGWRAYKSPLQMPYSRLVALQLAEKGLEWNISREDLTDCLEKVITDLTANNKNEAIKKVMALQEKVKLVMNHEVLCEICATLFLEPGENSDDYEPSRTRQKTAKLLQDIGLQQFFFVKYLTDYRKLEMGLAIDLQDYLAETRAQVHRLNKFLSLSAQRYSNMPIK